MTVAVFIGITSAIALLVLMYKLGIRKFMGYPVAVDIGASALFALLFAGTLTGMTVAVVAGLFFSLIVYLVRLVAGFERYSINKGWTYYPPRAMV